MESKIDLLEKYMSKKLSEIRYTSPPRQRAILASLRKGAGKEIGEASDATAVILDGFPEELMSYSSEASYAENATYTALILYVLHQQGRDPKGESMHKYGVGLGKAVRMMIPPSENSADSSIAKRFFRVCSARNVVEISEHLRGLVRLLKNKGIPMDYVQLAKDLYWLQFPEIAPKIRLKWGEDFYKTNKIEKEEEGNDIR